MKNVVCILFLCAGITTSSTIIGGNGEKASTEKKEKVRASFEIQAIGVSRDGLVSWTARNENGSLPYDVEQYIYDKWIKISEVNGIGTPTPNSYSVPVIFHSGENKFRVRQMGYDNMSRFSNAISFYSKKEAVVYSVTDKNQKLEFSNDTYYIIYNPFGTIMKQGYGISVDISDYKKGYYCLIYDNKLGGFQKKKVIFKHTSCPIIVNLPRIFRKKIAY